MVEFMENIARAFELTGAVVLILGLILAATLAIRRLVGRRDGRGAYQVFRETFGGVILLSLEILVAADLVQTVAVTPTLEGVAILGLIVLIRTFLSFSIEIEIEGVVPWRRALVSGARVTADAVRRDGERD